MTHPATHEEQVQIAKRTRAIADRIRSADPAERAAAKAEMRALAEAARKVPPARGKWFNEMRDIRRFG